MRYTLNQVKNLLICRPGSWLNPGRFLVLILLAGVCWLVLDSRDADATSEHAMPEVAGVVRDTSGAPIANAWVTNGTDYTFSDADGVFVFDSGKVLPGSALIVSSSGFGQEEIVAPDNGAPVEVTMDPFSVRGIYTRSSATRRRPSPPSSISPEPLR